MASHFRTSPGFFEKSCSIAGNIGMFPTLRNGFASTKGQNTPLAGEGRGGNGFFGEEKPSMPASPDKAFPTEEYSDSYF